MNDEGGSEEKQMDLCLTTVRFSTLTDLDSSEILSSLWCYSLGCAQSGPAGQAPGRLRTAVWKRKAAVFSPYLCILSLFCHNHPHGAGWQRDAAIGLLEQKALIAREALCCLSRNPSLCSECKGLSWKPHLSGKFCARASESQVYSLLLTLLQGQ